MENVKETKSLAAWFNYKTSEYDYRETPTDFSDYILQEPAAQAMYEICQEMGDSPMDATMKVLTVQIEGRKTKK